MENKNPNLFPLAENAGEFGTDQLKVLLGNVFQNLKLDRDGDGKVETAELTTALVNVLFPALAGFKGVSAEVRDLTASEIADVFAWAEENFPLQAQLREEVELVIAKTIGVIRSIIELYDAVLALREANRINLEPAETEG